MIVKAIYKDENFDYFRDKTTAEKIEDQTKRYFGDIFECDDDLAKERIKNKFVKKATKEEEKEYLDSINKDDDLKANDDTQNVEKPIEEYTDEELQEVIKKENIEVTDTATREELIQVINKFYEEQTSQGNGDAQ